MGGQACVLYGAAEFSRDIDFAIVASPANAAALRRALASLQAEVIAVPPFDLTHLRKGHAVHFRCKHPEAAGFRIDVMSRMRGVEPFAKLWARRTSMEVAAGLIHDLLSLPDLVLAKKTQRDKDWPMIRRLVEADYFAGRHDGKPKQLSFWLRELRTPSLLCDLASSTGSMTRKLAVERPLLSLALQADVPALERALLEEEGREREEDRRYWRPLRRELEQMRHES